jgi:mediator of RNA polymerase II transcription subunit 25
MPSPILCKRFFTENTMVFREIFEEPMHFGIGMSNSGGSRGMAALEGLVAALEVISICF